MIESGCRASDIGSIRSKKEETQESTGSGPVTLAKRFHERSRPRQRLGQALTRMTSLHSSPTLSSELGIGDWIWYQRNDATEHVPPDLTQNAPRQGPRRVHDVLKSSNLPAVSCNSCRTVHSSAFARPRSGSSARVQNPGVGGSGELVFVRLRPLYKLVERARRHVRDEEVDRVERASFRVADFVVEVRTG